MRTLGEIKNELNEKGTVHLTAEESSAYSFKTPEKEDSTIFISYSTTVTQGEQSVTRTASITVPRSFNSESALLILKSLVEENEVTA